MARKDETESPTLSVDDKFELLINALTARAGGGITKDDLQEILAGTAQYSAEAMKRSLKPENEAHPGISCFSFPEGDVAKQSVQEVESPPQPEFAGAVQADGSHDSAAEISEQVSVTAPRNGTDPGPIERADDEANRHTHQSSESKPEVTT